MSSTNKKSKTYDNLKFYQNGIWPTFLSYNLTKLRDSDFLFLAHQFRKSHFFILKKYKNILVSSLLPNKKWANLVY